MKLYIGNKNYSTWSLRPWFLLNYFKVSFTEKMLPLDTPQFYSRLDGICPNLKVPCLVDDDLVVWDSLAICEYINEKYLGGKAWPDDISERAIARALAAEMHSGFTELRAALPMNIRAERWIDISEEVRKEICRIEDIFSEQMTKNGKQYSGWLFGQFSIVDAMFAPVVLRFKTYRVKLNDEAQRYMDFVLSSSALQLWVDEAMLETEVVEADEAGEPVR
ncbi:glutathione S-transferase family protein [Vibrio salinus]|uniref:glutathione S-transferase family protein n=1 Tax=Vibrio salinus TaxID=2899784 RepID=UPI001E433433|nr:glutathione S-transferase family protein [Vibrio salinus]MCE0495310.1 glutathione S-transferase family protein [Vibrio salinus]